MDAKSTYWELKEWVPEQNSILEMELTRGNTVPNGFQSINSVQSVDSKRPLGAVNLPQELHWSNG